MGAKKEQTVIATNDSNQDLPDKKDGNTPEVQYCVQRSELFIGPFSSPEMLQQYNAIDDGLVERLFEYAERDQLHVHGIENEKVLNDRREISAPFFFSYTGLCGYVRDCN